MANRSHFRDLEPIDRPCHRIVDASILGLSGLHSDVRVRGHRGADPLPYTAGPTTDRSRIDSNGASVDPFPVIAHRSAAFGANPIPEIAARALAEPRQLAFALEPILPAVGIYFPLVRNLVHLACITAKFHRWFRCGLSHRFGPIPVEARNERNETTGKPILHAVSDPCEFDGHRDRLCVCLEWIPWSSAVLSRCPAPSRSGMADD